MAKKIEIPVDDYRIPECVNCLTRITDHVNGVMGSFEVASSELFEDFNKKAAESLKETALKTDRTVQDHFRRQEIKEDIARSEHFEKESAKQEDRSISFEEKVIDMLKYFMIIIGGATLIGVSVVGITWLEVQSKANKDDVPTMTEIQALTDLGDQYNRSVFVKKTEIKADTSAYYWFRENSYGKYSLRRGAVNKQPPYNEQNQNN